MIVDSHRLGAGEEAAEIATILTERGLAKPEQIAEAGAGPGDDLLLHVAGLHMHTLGVSAKLTLLLIELRQPSVSAYLTPTSLCTSSLRRQVLSCVRRCSQQH